MLRTVHYGPHEITPWCPGTGYLDPDAKSLKSYRSREPRTIWQSLQPKTEELGAYDLHICRFCFLYTSRAQDIPKHEKVCRYRQGPPGKVVHEDSKYRYYEVQVSEAALDEAANCAGTNGSASGAGNSGSSSRRMSHTRNQAKTKPTNTNTKAKSKPKPKPKSQAATETSAGTPEGPLFMKTPSGTEFNSVKLYLQSLALFGSLFLDTKSISFCVDAFLFYTGVEKSSGMVAGFFSKERHSWHDYNLACIVIFPPWQHHGLGQQFIALSYLLSRLEKRRGSPEKPLSRHGRLAYHRYWRQQFAEYAVRKRSNRKFTLDEVSEATAIDSGDLADALEAAGAFSSDRKYVALEALTNPKPKEPKEPKEEIPDESVAEKSSKESREGSEESSEEGD